VPGRKCVARHKRLWPESLHSIRIQAEWIGKVRYLLAKTVAVGQLGNCFVVGKSIRGSPLLSKPAVNRLIRVTEALPDYRGIALHEYLVENRRLSLIVVLGLVDEQDRKTIPN